MLHPIFTYGMALGDRVRTTTAKGNRFAASDVLSKSGAGGCASGVAWGGAAAERRDAGARHETVARRRAGHVASGQAR
jgi:hypothetical protein